MWEERVPTKQYQPYSFSPPRMSLLKYYHRHKEHGGFDVFLEFPIQCALTGLIGLTQFQHLIAKHAVKFTWHHQGQQIYASQKGIKVSQNKESGNKLVFDLLKSLNSKGRHNFT